MDPLSVLGPFIEMARGKYGVRRFVLMSASLVEKGGWGLGKVHEVLEGMGERGEVEWCVLRPTTFMGSFVLFRSVPPFFPLLGGV